LGETGCKLELTCASCQHEANHRPVTGSTSATTNSSPNKENCRCRGELAVPQPWHLLGTETVTTRQRWAGSSSGVCRRAVQAARPVSPFGLSEKLLNFRAWLEISRGLGKIRVLCCARGRRHHHPATERGSSNSESQGQRQRDIVAVAEEQSYSLRRLGRTNDSSEEGVHMSHR
jgi:hypothetical protein